MVDVRRHELGALTFEAGLLDQVPVVLVEAGIGKVNTATVASLLAVRFDADPILFTGVAGGLDPSLAIGDLVIGHRTVQHDAGVISTEGFSVYQAGHVPFFNPTDRLGYESSSALVEKARNLLAGLALPPLETEAGGSGAAPQIRFGTIVSGDQFINSEQKREVLHTQFEAAAVEMEGGALGQVGETLGFDWLDIRALSDLAGAQSHFDFGAFVDAVADSSATVVRRLVQGL